MNNFNKKNILFFSISTLIIHGCATKNEFDTESSTRVVVVSKVVEPKAFKAKTWGKSLSTKSKKDDCVDCYATLNNNTSNKIMKTNYKVDKVINTKYYGAYNYAETASDTVVKKITYANKYVTPSLSPINTSDGSYSTASPAIQVGAFREYGGAELYMKKYNTLSNTYNVMIKTGSKDNKPLHRVRIEGFKNKEEAKIFMYSYGIKDAFIVMK